LQNASQTTNQTAEFTQEQKAPNSITVKLLQFPLAEEFFVVAISAIALGRFQISSIKQLQSRLLQNCKNTI
jgi:hypothetical protein